ncbi:MAG: 50S ribosomal protein L4 [Candidatus Magasanikbacteria bacterium GW2011_GWC2_40_17]|uniref:Large ribosomal subunit protein uL4 n=1 Tax=Candidatus Magasanikbacteria bacterium GW2011_GWA2_42_32 TaxID=1619039 RepID=A0A0G1D459_9BACT|nr:MAG: 50S ribosomal protein L4 [Candidatus Magasanikbacteria bacterium GW2011_GWC2_40_17]KKS56803.1 MAG: 50S ribosomal protein L4 [Candidatus Magasanikbacteria bacterium GW2011_GWA2_42_32]OGH86012.1 MAG: 50S ribosomal protein L4 [Candidatus Magasanikbacteria bacterium RIFOXYB2_FULL_38_10]
MVKVNIYNFKGEVVATENLTPEIFEIKPRIGVLHEVSVGMEANQRQVLAHTKARGEVSGGGKKPWKQKGTGRARAGSSRSPLWKGGAVIFGPTKFRNFKVKINKKIKQLAFKMALSQKVAENSLILLETLSLDKPKTKTFVEIKKNLPLIGKKVLVVFPQINKEMKLASRNVPNVNQVSLNELSLLDLLKNDSVVTTKEAVEFWTKVYKK